MLKISPLDSFTYLKKRAKPRVLLLDPELRIALAEPEAVAMLLRSELAVEHEGDLRLLELLSNELGAITRNGTDGEERFLGPFNRMVFRARRLTGGVGTFLAVFIEQESRREELRAATREYSLTAREVDVLRLILEGMSGSDIAETLHIAEGTVNDYFKVLLRKTKAKNRSEMLARILNYTPPDKALGSKRSEG